MARSGSTVPAKLPLLGVDSQLCHKKCRLKCSDINDANRQHVFENVYQLDENSKNVYIFQSVTPKQPQVRRVKDQKYRSVTFKYTLRYHVIVDSRHLNVCKLAFTNLHQITKSKVEHVTKQASAGKSTPAPSGKRQRKTST